jgi:PAS domain S-box-containing protein
MTSTLEIKAAAIQAATPAEGWADALLTKIDVAVCHTSDTGHYLDVNDAYCQLYGYTREEIIGKHFTMVVPEAYRTAASKIHDDFINGVAEPAAEWTVVNRAGEEIRIWVVPVLAQSPTTNPGSQRPRPTKITLVEKL